MIGLIQRHSGCCLKFQISLLTHARGVRVGNREVRAPRLVSVKILALYLGTLRRSYCMFPFMLFRTMKRSFSPTVLCGRRESWETPGILNSGIRMHTEPYMTGYAYCSAAAQKNAVCKTHKTQVHSKFHLHSPTDSTLRTKLQNLTFA